MLGGTAFDSLSADIRYAGGVQSTAAPDLVRTVTLLGVVLLVAGALHLAAAASAWLSGIPVRGVAADLAPSLLADRRGVPRRALLLVARLPGAEDLGPPQRSPGPRGGLAGDRRGHPVGLADPPDPGGRGPGRAIVSATFSASSSPTSGRSGSCRTARPSSGRSP